MNIWKARFDYLNKNTEYLVEIERLVQSLNYSSMTASYIDVPEELFKAWCQTEHADEVWIGFTEIDDEIRAHIRVVVKNDNEDEPDNEESILVRDLWRNQIIGLRPVFDELLKTLLDTEATQEELNHLGFIYD